MERVKHWSVPSRSPKTETRYGVSTIALAYLRFELKNPTVSDNRGGVMHADLREDKKKHRRWKVAENKVGCISLNPANENMFATAHLNRDVRIWDSRKLMKIESTKSDYYTTYQKACVASYEHGKAVTSAYFDPSGRHLVTTCYDDKIRGELE